jgi:chromodomain-helicase-DNA-binding protein 1
LVSVPHPNTLRTFLTDDQQVKWQDKAHYHSTWEDYPTASSHKGWRKLDNYYKGPVTTDMYFHSRKKYEPEEFEQHMVARESERESQLDFHVVERVIDSRDGEDETEYFVKCKSEQLYPFCAYLTIYTIYREGLDV